MKKGQFKRGYKPFRKRVESSRNAINTIKSCKSCKYFSDEDECSNTGVTSFDFVSDPVKNVEFCTYWTPSWIKD